ncbi:MAG: hypothetical protein AAFU54_27130 [Chloroflexota bacterium]
MSDDLMLAFRWYGSDTYDSVNRSSHLEYGYIDYKTHPDLYEKSPSIAYFGMKLKDHPVFLANIWQFLANNVTFADFKDECEYCPDITEDEWQDAVAFIIEYLWSLHSRGTESKHSRTQGIQVSGRAFIYKLFSASQIVDAENVSYLQHDLFSLMGIQTEHIEYGVYHNTDSGERREYFTLKFKGKNVPLWELPHGMPLPPTLAEEYPFLAKPGELKNIPDDFKRNYIADDETTTDWDARYEEQFPTLWDAVWFATYAMLSAFDRRVP